jgi:hypothetical protein
VVLDLDSTEVAVFGEQEQSAYNGHFESTCYHPLLLFNDRGDCLEAQLRPGNVASAEGWEDLLLAEIERLAALGIEVLFRGDAAFARPELYQALEERAVKYAIRLPANPNLERNLSELLKRPVGRPSRKPLVRYKSFLYQAASWKQARRVVAKVEFHLDELFPRVGFIVTNLTASNRAVVRFYNKRGTAEQWIKEGKQAVAMTRLSCHRFCANQVRLWLSVIAYNLGNLWRRLTLPKTIGNWSLTSLQRRLVKTGGRLIKHARYYWLLLAESHLTRRLFAGMLHKIAALPFAGGIVLLVLIKKWGEQMRRARHANGEVFLKIGRARAGIGFGAPKMSESTASPPNIGPGPGARAPACTTAPARAMNGSI